MNQHRGWRNLNPTWAMRVNIAANFLVGGAGGKGGHGGKVNVINKGALSTEDDSASGIFPQNMGGGGNFGLLDATAGDYYAGNVGGTGKEGAFSIAVNAPISVSGSGAQGIFARSVCGPDEENAKDIASDVTIDVKADVHSQKSLGRCIIAQSVGGKGNDSVTVTIADDVIFFIVNKGE